MLRSINHSVLREDYHSKEKFFLIFPGKDNLLPDTPENRILLSEKFDGLKIKYEKERPRVKGRDIDL